MLHFKFRTQNMVEWLICFLKLMPIARFCIKRTFFPLLQIYLYCLSKRCNCPYKNWCDGIFLALMSSNNRIDLWTLNHSLPDFMFHNSQKKLFEAHAPKQNYILKTTTHDFNYRHLWEYSTFTHNTFLNETTTYVQLCLLYISVSQLKPQCKENLIMAHWLHFVNPLVHQSLWYYWLSL